MTVPAAWRAWQARRWLRSCAQLGLDPHLVGEPTIDADDGQLRIGDRFRLASRPVPSHLVAGPGAILEIGDDVAIGCGAAVAAQLRIQIGSGTRIGPYVLIMDTNFHTVGDQSLQHDCLPVSIGAGCRIGSRVTITRGVTIGDGAEILAGSVVSSPVPAGACAAGGRARIIGRAGDLASRWESPAAQLPDLLMAALDLRFPPDLDDTQIPTHLWTDARIPLVLEAIDDACGIAIDRTAGQNAKTYAELAAAVRQAYAYAR
jgi:acetyltransferase-like isoleucine patch superfamily enzyme